jgi:fructokinase
MSKQVCIFGEVLFGCFPDGREVLGGAPFNVARHFQAFGQSPLFVSHIGNDEAGRHMRQAMFEWGMEQGGLQVDPEHPTGRVEVTLAGGEPTCDIVADSAYDFIAPGALPMVDPGLIYHGSLALRNPISEAALQTLKSGADARIFVDVNLRPPWWHRERVLELLRDADWVKLNRDELELLGDGGGDDLTAAEVFRVATSIECLVITLGAAGALAFAADGNPVRVAPQSGTRVVDAVGAGDAFASEPVQRRGATVSDPKLYRSYREEWALTP